MVPKFIETTLISKKTIRPFQEIIGHASLFLNIRHGQSLRLKKVSKLVGPGDEIGAVDISDTWWI